jgi:hypothetical protein
LRVVTGTGDVACEAGAKVAAVTCQSGSGRIARRGDGAIVGQCADGPTVEATVLCVK